MKLSFQGAWFQMSLISTTASQGVLQSNFNAIAMKPFINFFFCHLCNSSLIKVFKEINESLIREDHKATKNLKRLLLPFLRLLKEVYKNGLLGQFIKKK